MTYVTKIVLLPIFILCYVSPTNINAGFSGQSNEEIENLISQMPAHNLAQKDSLCRELIAFGPEGVFTLCSMLTPPGDGGDTNVRFALSGLTAYVHRTDFEEERKMYAKAIINSLDSAEHDEVRAFLIRQLQLAGKKESIQPLR